MVMYERVTHQPAEFAYIACDLADHETLIDYRKRAGSTSRRRWWQVGQR